MDLDENVKTTNNLQNIKNKFGNCFGMTISWINASKKLGGVTKSWQIGNGVIRQALLNNQWGRQQVEGAIKKSGLHVKSTSSEYSSFAIQEGHIVIVIDKPAHAMGARVSGGTYQFFDPNSGLHNASDKDDLYQGVWAYLNKTYPGWSLRSLSVVS